MTLLDAAARRPPFAEARERAVAETRAEYALLSPAQAQRRLRIRLRAFVVQDETRYKHLRTPRIPPVARSPASKMQRPFWDVERSRPPSAEALRHWRGLAATREYGRQRREDAARRIQRWHRETWRLRPQRSRMRPIRLSLWHLCRLLLFIRRFERAWCWRLPGPYDPELPSTSSFVSIDIHTTPAPFIRERAFAPSSSPPPSRLSALDSYNRKLPSKPTPPEPPEAYKLELELLGVRDLSLPTMDRRGGAIRAELTVVHRTNNDEAIGRLVTSDLPIRSELPNEALAWSEEILKIGVDPETLSPVAVVGECAITVNVLYLHEGSPAATSTVLGRLTISLDLLETPLAERYAMKRWFPLERATRGGPAARGEVHLRVEYHMRHPTDATSWEAFRPPAPSSSAAARSGVQSSAGPSRRGSGMASKPPLSPQKATLRRSSAPPSPIRLRERRGSIHRAKAEALSPPSSPSSYSSEQSSASDAWFDSPVKARARSPPSSTKRRASSSLGIVGKATSPVQRQGSPTTRASTTTTTTTPKKPFLKRKPYKIVFQKLDWSAVSSKTDSNLFGRAEVTEPVDTHGKGPAKPPRAAAAAPTAVDSSQPTTEAPHAQSSVTENLARLNPTIDAVHQVCRVTSQTCGLAQMKYRQERKRLIASLATANKKSPPPNLDHTEREPPTTSVAESSTDESLQRLWRELHEDADGSTYVRHLVPKTEEV